MTVFTLMFEITHHFRWLTSQVKNIRSILVSCWIRYEFQRAEILNMYRFLSHLVVRVKKTFIPGLHWRWQEDCETIRRCAELNWTVSKSCLGIITSLFMYMYANEREIPEAFQSSRVLLYDYLYQTKTAYGSANSGKLFWCEFSVKFQFCQNWGLTLTFYVKCVLMRQLFDEFHLYQRDTYFWFLNILGVIWMSK